MNDGPSNSAAVTLPEKCIHCEQALESALVCMGCHTLQHPGEFNNFALFGLRPRFDLDPVVLRERYLRLTREIHPDRAAGNASVDLLDRERLSARVNEAYRLLLAPISRAEYLLELSGGASSAQDKRVSPDLLTSTLAIREEIDEARADGNAALLGALLRKVSMDRDAVTRAIAEIAKQLPGDAALRSELRLKLNSVRYFDRMIEQFESDPV